MYPTKLITLTTDFGNQDHFVGAMKGTILRIHPEINIVDICHHIPPQNILKAQNVILDATPYFPPQTIHVVVVDPTVGSSRRILYLETKSQQRYLLPDNGLASILKEEITLIREVKQDNPRSSTFHGRDIFAPAAANLAIGNADCLAETLAISEIADLPITEAIYVEEGIFGEVIDIDHFGNLITNISKEMFIARNIQYISLNNQTIQDFYEYYSRAPQNQPFYLFNSSNLLEISLNQGSASKFLEVKVGDEVKCLEKILC